MYSYGPLHMAEQKWDDQLQHTYSSYVRIRDVALKTYQRRWTIGKSGESGSRISVLAARHDDEDDDDFDWYVRVEREKKNIKYGKSILLHKIQWTNSHCLISAIPSLAPPFSRPRVGYSEETDNSIILLFCLFLGFMAYQPL